MCRGTTGRRHHLPEQKRTARRDHRGRHGVTHTRRQEQKEETAAAAGAADEHVVQFVWHAPEQHRRKLLLQR